MNCSEGSAADKYSAELANGENGTLGSLLFKEFVLNRLEFECVGVFPLPPSLFNWSSLN